MHRLVLKMIVNFGHRGRQFARRLVANRQADIFRAHRLRRRRGNAGFDRLGDITDGRTVLDRFRRSRAVSGANRACVAGQGRP
jgi:hypothetical protein